MLKPVTHVLFDMDGLLLNTEDLYMVGFQDVASRYGKVFTFELKTKIMGQQSKEFAGTIINELDLPLTVEEFLAETRAIFEKSFPDCKILPGVEKLIRHLHENNIGIGLATSSSKESYELKAVHHQELFDLFPYKTWGSSDPDVKRGKPFPDIFFVAANKFPEKPSPDQCLVFEDSVNGVKAARAAGMQVVMVPDPRLDRSLTTEATLVLDSVEDFKPELFGLPPYK
ncbi:pseudouridine-5'-phosphatase-like isoform X3 [Trichoplusia ni]|uniref:pseudouridine 5'-phosphatase n=1 Tax=Trichoplusia ni TaxID=7111 RepID=A0A7E5W6H0_TRINI|nr:pseudouridine-5'-phosphatase-like isoform X3 [Trichoplusia ni]